MTPDQIQRIDARRQPGCGHPTAASGVIDNVLLCNTCGVDYFDGELEFFSPPTPFVPQYATDEQCAAIDSLRSVECKHERASAMRPWCLICQRCGSNFHSGRLWAIEKKTEADDARDGVQRLATLGYES